MATLAFLAESERRMFDIIHCGEDLHFFSDSFIFVALYFAFEVFTESEPFKSIDVVIHGKICNLNDSRIAKEYILNEISENALKSDELIVYNDTFLDEMLPSNQTFEGFNYHRVGRKASFDGYKDMYFPPPGEINVSIGKRDELSVINMELSGKEKFEPGKKYIMRLGFIIEPPKGRVRRFWIYPAEIKYNIHFYTREGLSTEDSKWLEDNKRRIADIRLYYPKKRDLPTCDFFYSLPESETILEIPGVESDNRVPFTHTYFRYNVNRYHRYPLELSKTKPQVKGRDFDGVEEVKVLEFGGMGPTPLTIKRAETSLYPLMLTLFIALLALLTSSSTSFLNSLIFSLFFTVLAVHLFYKFPIKRVG